MGDACALPEAEQDGAVGIGDSDADQRCAEQHQQQQSRISEPGEHRQDVGDVAQGAIHAQRHTEFESVLRKSDEPGRQRPIR